MEVVVLKLVSGEEMIGIMADTFGEFDYRIEKPRVLQVMHSQNGMQVGLIPWLVSVPDATVPLSSAHVMTCVDAPVEIEKAYLQQVSSIQLLG